MTDQKAKLRARLVEEISSILVGPRDTDEKLSANPADTYLTGILWPKDTDFSADEDESLAKSAEGRDDDAADAAVPGYRTIRPCSIGLTFTVPLGVAVRLSTGTTARYEPVEVSSAEGAGDSASNTSRHLLSPEPTAQIDAPQRKATCFEWHRQQLDYVLDLEPRPESKQWRTSEFQNSSGENVTDPLIEVHIKYRVDDVRVTITATLINLAPDDSGPDSRTDRNCLFQSEIVAAATGPKSLLEIVPRKPVITADDADSRSNALIYRDSREFAVGHGVSAAWSESWSDSVVQVATTWLPRSTVKSTSFKGHPSLNRMRVDDANPFAAEWLGEPGNRRIVIDSMNLLCDTYDAWIDELVESRLSEFDGTLRQAAAENLERCRKASVRMRRGVECLEADDTVWRAFTLANQALDMQSRFKSKGDRAGPLVWRPFQLAFVLLVIPGIADPEDHDRGTMDLLWFPTGGGKTEAYLGLTAFSIFHRRLTSGWRRENTGTDVLMRYTLRLLTVQQFQRAAALITACESIRLANVGQLGSAPIELGLYVGDDSTPNKLAKARERLAEERDGARPRSTPRQLLNCPVCKGELSASDYNVDLTAEKIGIRCRNTECEWHRRSLPVQTVDEAIFRARPSLLIGTVDKFAQLPRNAQLSGLFGLGTPEQPGLIIQDELHLISGPLGTVTGLYEAAIDLLCSKQETRPKIVGSTATIGQAESQVRALFDRAVLQFPPPGIDSSDSFFAVRDDEAPDRLYMGISSAGRSPKFALQAVLGTAMQIVHTERESGNWNDDQVDPYWTTVAYFNSLRELGGAIVMTLDDVPRTMAFVAKRQNASPRPLHQEPTELSGRVPSSEIPEELKRLSVGLGEDMWAGEPVDAVLASNMISVGVDVPRLGLMVVNGQPKSTAEYIQATSRVGRGIPGLICTVLNFGRPRDVAHFEHFQAYHSAMYRRVEATSVTPWAPRARDKALHAVLIAAVRQLNPDLRPDECARDFEEGPLVRQIVDYLVDRIAASSDGEEVTETRAELEAIVSRWASRAAEQRLVGKKLRYWERPAPAGRTVPHLMRDAERTRRTDSSAWPTPNSMREIEPSTAFVLKQFHNPARSEDVGP